MSAKDYTGRVFGRLTLVERIAGTRRTRYKCVCSCGKEIVVLSSCVVSGNTKSCGCLFKDAIRPGPVTHGMYKSPEYSAWKSMWKRCTNPNTHKFQEYKDRAPPEEWKDFTVFFAEVGKKPTPKHTLDRIDNAKPYGPGNVRWATPKQQASNTKANVLLTYAGITKTADAWAKDLGIVRSTLYSRLRRGCSVEEALGVHLDSIL